MSDPFHTITIYQAQLEILDQLVFSSLGFESICMKVIALRDLIILLQLFHFFLIITKVYIVTHFY